uniref:Solute carrier family 13 member 1 n=1 Tax=Steinernema glaseri TaxID=37863 RepID=A0A1I8ALT0_9BILA
MEFSALCPTVSRHLECTFRERAFILITTPTLPDRAPQQKSKTSVATPKGQLCPAFLIHDGGDCLLLAGFYALAPLFGGKKATQSQSWTTNSTIHIFSLVIRIVLTSAYHIIRITLSLRSIISNSQEAKCAYVVLVMGLFWMTEILPLAVTALLPVIMYPLLGVVTAKKISTEYLSDANFIFFGSLVMAVGVENSNLHERIALRILVSSGSNPRWYFLFPGPLIHLLQAHVRIPSGYVPALHVDLQHCHDRYDGAYRHGGHRGIRRDSLSKVRPFFTISYSAHPFFHLYEKDILSLYRNLDYGCSNAPRANRNQVVDCERALSGSSCSSTTSEEDKNVYKAMLLSICYSASIGGTGTLIGTGPNIVLSDDLNKMYGGMTEVTFISWIWFAFPQLVISIIFCWLWLQFLFIGFRRRLQNDKDEAVHEMLRKKYDNLGRMRFNEKLIAIVFFGLVLLWFFRQPKIFPGWGQLFSEGYVTDGTSAMLAAISLFVLPAQNPFRSLKDQTELKTLMDWDVMKKRFSWSTLLLLGGGYAMAAGVRESGLSDWIGEQMKSITTLPEWVFVLISCAMITALTEFSSNVATASIFLPLLSTIARQNRTNPLLYMLPATLSCSYSFMLPAGTPPNAIVFGSRMLKVVDMAKAGVVLNLFSLVMTVLFTHTYGYWLFDLGKYPTWVNWANATQMA